MTLVPLPCRTRPNLKSCSGTAQALLQKGFRHPLNIKIPAVHGCFQTNSDTATKTQHFPFSLNDTPCGPAAAVVAAASDDFRHRLATARHNFMVVACHVTLWLPITSLDNPMTTQIPQTPWLDVTQWNPSCYVILRKTPQLPTPPHSSASFRLNTCFCVNAA